MFLLLAPLPAGGVADPRAMGAADRSLRALRAGFLALRLPAALLLGPMIAAILVAATGGAARMPFPPFYAAQAIIGAMIADKLPLSLAGEVMRNWPIFLGGVLSVIVAASLLGWLLARWRVLPGATAVWGSSPGAATAMTLMSEYGADMRLVALMQYLRVVCCAVFASVVARLWVVGSGGAPPPIVVRADAADAARRNAGVGGVGVLAGQPANPRRRDADAAGAWPHPQIDWLGAVCTAALAAGGGLRRRRLGHRACRFTPDILAHAARASGLLAAILALIAICGGFAAILVVAAGVDPLTAFLATVPAAPTRSPSSRPRARSICPSSWRCR